MAASRRALTIMLVSIACIACVTYGLSVAVVGSPTMTADGVTYNTSALRLLNTGVYSSYSLYIGEVRQPDAYQMPGYSLLLAFVYLFLPRSQDAQATLAGAIPAITWMHFICAVATAVLVSAIAYRTAGLRVGWIAGILAALYLPFGAEAMSTWPENVRLVLSALCVFLSIGLFKSDEAHAVRWMIAFGVCGGIAVMVQPVVVLWLFVPIAFWAWKHRDDLRRTVPVVLIGCAGIAVVMAPWIIRNAVRLGEFVPLTKHAGSVWIDSIGGIELSPEEDAVYLAAVAQGKDGYREVAFDRLQAKWEQSPTGFIAWKLQGAWELVSQPWSSHENPFTPIAADIPKIVPDSYRTMSKTTYSAWMAVIRSIHLIVLALALAGIWLTRRRTIVWLLASGPLYFFVVNTVIFPWQRYFYPAMPAMLVLASLCIGYLAAVVVNRRAAAMQPLEASAA